MFFHFLLSCNVEQHLLKILVYFSSNCFVCQFLITTQCRIASIEKIGLFFIQLVCLPISIYNAEHSSSFFIICLFLSNSFVCLFPIIMQCIVALFEKIGLFFIQLVCLPISIYNAEHSSSFFIICSFFIQLVCLQCNVA